MSTRSHTHTRMHHKQPEPASRIILVSPLLKRVNGTYFERLCFGSVLLFISNDYYQVCLANSSIDLVCLFILIDKYKNNRFPWSLAGKKQVHARI